MLFLLYIILQNVSWTFPYEPEQKYLLEMHYIRLFLIKSHLTKSHHDSSYKIQQQLHLTKCSSQVQYKTMRHSHRTSAGRKACDAANHLDLQCTYGQFLQLERHGDAQHTQNLTQ